MTILIGIETKRRYRNRAKANEVDNGRLSIFRLREQNTTHWSWYCGTRDSQCG